MKKNGIILLIVLMGCGIAKVEPLAIVEGKVKIGPLCGIIPVGVNNTGNPCGLSNEEMDKIYGNYSVVLKSTMNAVVTQKKLDRTGLFSFEVKEGNYTLMIESSVTNALTFAQQSEIQKSVTASATQKQYLELNVNTGIR